MRSSQALGYSPHPPRSSSAIRSPSRGGMEFIAAREVRGRSE
jgi:hypothetical protein